MAPYCKKVLLILFGILLGISTIETLLRLFPYQAVQIFSIDMCPKYVYERDPFLVWKLKPHVNYKMIARGLPFYSIQTV
ncbi:MAG TPA: hypothetical protein ACFYD5_02030, partial [Candidatus Tripitaka sp. YC43]